MASVFFDNVPFFRKFVGDAAEQIKQETPPIITSQSQPSDAKNTSDISGITICTRIRPLIKEEGDENHVTGIFAKGRDQAVLFEPRIKFRRAAIPDATVR